MDIYSVLYLIVIMLVICFFAAMCMAVLGYIVYLFAKAMRYERDTWENLAKELGLKINEKGGGFLFKPMVGNYKNCQVEILVKGEASSNVRTEHYTVCNAYLPTKMDFLFEVRSESNLAQTFASALGKGDFKIGIPGFDKSFFIDCYYEEKMSNLLGVDLENGRTPNLITDLLLVRKSYNNVKIDDELVCITVYDKIIESSEIKPVLNEAVYLAERVEKARRKVEKEFS